MLLHARVAEPEDARDLGSRGETREGSSPSSRMKTWAIESRESKVRSSKPRQCERERQEPSRSARGSALADRKRRLAAGRSGEARSRRESLLSHEDLCNRKSRVESPIE